MEAETRELRALEAEIAALQRQCEELPAPWEKPSGVGKSFQKVPHSDSEVWESSKDLKSQLGHLKSELSFLSTLTGFNIRNYSKKIEDITNTEATEEGTKKILQSHRLSGNCSMVTFQLEFQVLEIQTKEKLSSIITDLSIIMDPAEYSELSEFASRAEEKRDLLMFFQSLHFFVEWHEYRKHTFKHFKPASPKVFYCSHMDPVIIFNFNRTENPQTQKQEKYPETVHLPEGACSDYMEICSPSRPGFELLVVWRIQIDGEGKVSPKLDLLTKVSQQALELDKNRVIETAPLSFRTLLGVLGIEAALDSLIKLLCGGNS